MKWEDNRRSSNVEDKRGESGGMNFGSNQKGSMMMLVPIIKMLIGTKIGRIVLVVGVIAYFMGYNPLALLSLGQTSNTETKQVVNTVKDDNNAQFVSAVLAQTEDVWAEIFKKHDATYPQPKLVLFRNSVKSACGFASSATGPFYCPSDKKVYLDLAFFDELAKRHDAPGDFAQAYVIAHEIGHHIQNVVGTITKVHNAKQKVNKTQANALQVKVELQADCYAGIWANYSKKRFNSLEDGDIDEALRAASAIGDDTLQKQAQGYVVPDAFTHGSSADRMKWFNRGYTIGTLSACNTFK